MPDLIPAGPFNGLPWNGFEVVVIDPPWDFSSNSIEKPGRNVRRHYDMMTIEEIGAMPLGQILAKDAGVFCWITGPMLAIGAHLSLFKRWGLVPSTISNVWLKLKRNHQSEMFSARDIFMGNGFTTRKACEFVVLGVKGHSIRVAADVLDAIIEPVREHSRKPKGFYDAIERYAGPNARRIDIFARQSRPDWTTWGLEREKFDQQRNVKNGTIEGFEEQAEARRR